MFLNLFTVVSAVLAIFVLISLISVIAGVPFVPTHQKQALKMMELAQIKPGMKVIDLGSGAGRLLFLAAGAGAQTVGYELNFFLVWWTRLAAVLKKLSKNVTVYDASIYKADVHDADIVLCFLMEGPMKKLEPKLFAEMKPGSRIISYVFSFPNHQFSHKEQGIMVYDV